MSHRGWKWIAVLAWTSIAFQVGPAWAQRDLKDIPDPDPELERKALELADGFEINLFAADPALAKPIQMNFDSGGRLWVACSETYPQIKPGEKANDRIIILEDRDGDGKADRTTIFADGLLIPTGLEPGDGGVYVANSTELVHLSDSNGDGKADRRRVVLSGFGTEDTHHLLHTLRWGHDGNLYFNQSIYIHSHIETPFGVRRLGGGGIWQFRPETGRLEVFMRGWWNAWGHHFDRWGQSFITDGAGTEGINPGVPGASYTATPNATRVLQGLNPGHPKYCGCEIVSGRHLPDSWQGSLLTNDFRAHRVCRFSLASSGSFYTARQEPDLVRTNHPAFRPIDVKMGPDGAIYLADWYNPIIQHGEVDFRDPRRDHVHGRIWRITAKGRPLAPRPRLLEASIEQLLDALESPEQWTRHHARRVLHERDARERVLSALKAWIAKRPSARPENEPNLLEALWTYQTLDEMEPQLLTALLKASDYRVRAAATRVLSGWQARLPRSLELLAGQVADEHPLVRREAVRALGQSSAQRAADLALSVLDRPLDPILDYSLWLTLRELEPQWLPELQKGRLPFASNVRRLAFALQAAGSPAVMPALVRLLQSGSLPAENEPGVLELVGSLGGPLELRLLFQRLLDPGTSSARRLLLLTTLEQAARSRRVQPSGNLSRLSLLLKDDSDRVRAEAMRLAGLWKLEGLRPELTEAARADRTDDLVRQAALDGLVALGGSASKETLAALAAHGPLPRRRMALLALTTLDPHLAAQQGIDLLSKLPAESSAEIFEAFFRHKNGATLLTQVLHNQSLPPDVAKVAIRTVRISGRPSPDLVDALARAGKLTFGVRKLTPAQMKEMVAEVSRRGDPARGEAVFRRKDMVCLRCHAIGGAGGQVGPDLSSIGASAPIDYLVDSLLEPNKAVKENYHSLLVSTTRGLQYTGIKVRQTKTDLVLRNAEDQEVSIPLQDVDEQSQGGSLMPEGLTDTLTHDELVDLVRFLSELGKVGPYSVGKERVARRWEALEPGPQADEIVRRNDFSAPNGVADTLQWSPLYTRVNGTLPMTDLPAVKQNDTTVAVLRCQLDLAGPGKTALVLNDVHGLSFWLDGKRMRSTKRLDMKLTGGVHNLIVVVDLKDRTQPIQMQMEDGAEDQSRARWISGK